MKGLSNFYWRGLRLPGKKWFFGGVRRPSKATSTTQRPDYLVFPTSQWGFTTGRRRGVTASESRRPGFMHLPLYSNSCSRRVLISRPLNTWKRITRDFHHGCTVYGEQQDWTSDMYFEVDRWRYRPPGDTCKGAQRSSTTKAQCNLVSPVFSKPYSDEDTKALGRVRVFSPQNAKTEELVFVQNLQKPLKITILIFTVDCGKRVPCVSWILLWLGRKTPPEEGRSDAEAVKSTVTQWRFNSLS